MCDAGVLMIIMCFAAFVVCFKSQTRKITLVLKLPLVCRSFKVVAEGCSQYKMSTVNPCRPSSSHKAYENRKLYSLTYNLLLDSAAGVFGMPAEAVGIVTVVGHLLSEEPERERDPV